MSIHINLVVEDELHLNILTKSLYCTSQKFIVNRVFGRRGKDYIKQNLRAYNQAAKLTPYLVLTDLDSADCPLIVINAWLSFLKAGNLIFRIAVREAEAWLLSDRNNFAVFMGISKNLIDPNPESIADPKQYIINLARRSRKRNVREDLVPEGRATVGRNYNTCLADFIFNHWDIEEAKNYSKSLSGLINALNGFSTSDS